MIMLNRISSDNISLLKENEVFVFGSNTIGRHGKGAAKFAMKFGAKYGVGEGIQGRTYGIPTKGSNMSVSLKIEQIKIYVDNFIYYSIDNPDKIFLVTEIGCGLAGYNPKQIAHLFREAINLENIYLPKSFCRILNHHI